MPCFKGLAVSIHTPDGPIAEHGIQRVSRASRISSYIPVPPAKVPVNSTTGKPEQSTFAVSITLLTPGLNVPYSTPRPTPSDPHPKPRIVGGLPGLTGERGKYESTVTPYIPRTANPNETIAAYIYFDGRPKEEVATLLRRGEETWVNSRWVSVPESEGGGLAEREFLFREVGLERWLNGLDLQGSTDQKAEKIEKRHRRLEKSRRQHKDQPDSDEEEDSAGAFKRLNRNGVLRYGGEDGSPVEDMGGDDELFSQDSDSDDEPPQPEAAGQIKIALFRVLASGEIKRGEYSPQFDAHDDDEMENGASNGDADGDVDHTTSFAKPKTLDPKSISTQTVTGLDPADQPYATFTFFYRGQKQLQKMGILPTPTAIKVEDDGKRRASGPDFSKLAPLTTFGVADRYLKYRESPNGKRKKSRDADAMDSDADDEDDARLPKDGGVEIRDEEGNVLSPEDAKRQEKLAEGVQKIKLKRAHSAEPLSESLRKPPARRGEDSPGGATPHSNHSTSANAGTPPDRMSPARGENPTEPVGSPFKRQRGSLSGLDSQMFAPVRPTTGEGATSFPTQGESGLPSTTFTPEAKQAVEKEASDEELAQERAKKKRKLDEDAVPPTPGPQRGQARTSRIKIVTNRYGQRLLVDGAGVSASSSTRAFSSTKDSEDADIGAESW